MTLCLSLFDLLCALLTLCLSQFVGKEEHEYAQSGHEEVRHLGSPKPNEWRSKCSHSAHQTDPPECDGNNIGGEQLGDVHEEQPPHAIHHEPETS